MPPLPHDNDHKPRVVLYHQTHYKPNGEYVSLLPLLTEATEFVGVTHIIVAAIHLNASPGDITLNDDPPAHPKNDPLREDLAVLQSIGIRVLGMLGGAARGTFARLDYDGGDDEERFESYYIPLRDMIRSYKFDGLDLDVEEDMSLKGIIQLIDRLKLDFGDAFSITLAPVARAMHGGEHLSGFDYEALEVLRGSSVEWYNVQFYNGWGSVGDGSYDEIVGRGWKQEKIVAGVLTHPENGHGWVMWEEVGRAVMRLREVYPRFGGVMGWEYFNAVADGEEGKSWEWGEGMMKVLEAV